MKTKNVMIVNDYAGVGKVAANVVAPLMSVAQLEPVVLPTLLLSSNLGAAAGEVITQNTLDIFTPYLKHWDEMGFNFEHMATGYFDTVDQIIQFRDYFLEKQNENPDLALYVDPTMGDHGAIYEGFNPTVPNEIGQLIEHATLVKPNLTEACLIADHPYSPDMPVDEMKALAQEIHDLGAKNTVITGLRQKDDQGQETIGFVYFDEQGESGVVSHKYYDEDFFGTGDLVFALMVTFLIKGFSLKEALEKTGRLTEKVIDQTLALQRDKRFGLYFESIYGDLLEEISK